MAAASASQASAPDAGAHYSKLSPAYEDLMGGSATEIANHVLTLVPPITPSSVVLDNGCGPAMVTQAILSAFPTGTPAPRIYADDNAPGMISLTEAKAKQHSWSTVTAHLGDAMALTYPSDTFTHSFTHLVLFLVKEPGQAAAEIYRTLQPGGTAAVVSWYDHGCIPFLRAAQKAVRPDLPDFQFPLPKERFTLGWLEEQMVSGGFDREQIKASTVQCAMRQRDTNALVENMDVMFGFMYKAWSEEDQAKWRAAMKQAFVDAEAKGDLVKGENDVEIPMVAGVVICTK